MWLGVGQVEWFQREKAIDLVISHLNLAGALGGIHKCAEALEHTVFAERSAPALPGATLSQTVLHHRPGSRLFFECDTKGA